MSNKNEATMTIMQRLSSFFGCSAVAVTPAPPPKIKLFLITIGERKITATEYWVYTESGTLCWRSADGLGGSVSGPYLVESFWEDHSVGAK